MRRAPAPRFGEAHQRGETEDLGLVGQQVGQHQCQMQRLGRQGVDRRALRRELPVDRVGAVHGLQHRGQPLGEVFAFGQHEGDAGVANAFLGPHQALRHCGGFDGEGLGDGGGLHAEHRLQHQRRADVRGDGGMGAHQHELQPPVRNGGHVVFQIAWSGQSFSLSGSVIR